jgi:Demerecviridae HNH endonuclease
MARTVKAPPHPLLEMVSKEMKYDPETGVVVWTRPYKWRRHLNGTVKPMYKGKRIKMYVHQIAWFLQTEAWPDRFVDHRDRNPANNKWENLRLATPRENAINRKKTTANTSSKYKGVVWIPAKQQWQATVTINSKYCYTYHKTELEAAYAYDSAALKAYGEFASCNFLGKHCLFPVEQPLEHRSSLYVVSLADKFWVRVDKDGPTMGHMNTAC